jgi:hypothetical protein
MMAGMHDAGHLRALVAQYLRAAAFAQDAGERDRLLGLATRCQEMIVIAELPRAARPAAFTRRLGD